MRRFFSSKYANMIVDTYFKNSRLLFEVRREFFEILIDSHLHNNAERFIIRPDIPP